MESDKLILHHWVVCTMRLAKFLIRILWAVLSMFCSHHTYVVVSSTAISKRQVWNHASTSHYQPLTTTVKIRQRLKKKSVKKSTSGQTQYYWRSEVVKNTGDTTHSKHFPFPSLPESWVKNKWSTFHNTM